MSLAIERALRSPSLDIARVPKLEYGRTVVVADAHLLPFVPRLDQPRFNTFLKVFESADNIVFAGDMFETELVDNRPAEIRRILSSGWRPLFDIANRKFTVMLRGNHDPDFPEFKNPFWDIMADMVQFNRWGKKVVIVHGHQLRNAAGHHVLFNGPLGRELRPRYRKFQEWFNNSRVGALLQYAYEFGHAPEHRELAGLVDPRRELWILAHRHKGINNEEQGFIILPNSNRHRIGWLVFDDDGLRLKKDWTRNYRNTEPVTQHRAQ